jgi:2-hydroxychromene-2-carboxylate isomerase
VAGQPLFHYDFNSPYSYLAASRVDDVLPLEARWSPIAFGVLIRAIGKVPWSLTPGREDGMREIEQRAAARGLPPIRWPEGWPVDSYSLLPLRAALVADDAGRLREFSHAVYRLVFAEGGQAGEIEALLEAAREAGVEPDAVREGVEDPAVKDRLRAATDAAGDRGVTGVPTVVVEDQLFWGDDRLEHAAAALAAGAER